MKEQGIEYIKKGFWRMKYNATNEWDVIKHWQLALGKLTSNDAEMKGFYDYLTESEVLPWKESWELLRTLGTFKATMKEGVAHFCYKKKDGSTRWAFGTRAIEILHRHGAYLQDIEYPKAKSVFSYFDIEKGAWRTFCIENLMEIDNNYEI